MEAVSQSVFSAEEKKSISSSFVLIGRCGDVARLVCLFTSSSSFLPTHQHSSNSLKNESQSSSTREELFFSRFVIDQLFVSSQCLEQIRCATRSNRLGQHQTAASVGRRTNANAPENRQPRDRWLRVEGQTGVLRHGDVSLSEHSLGSRHAAARRTEKEGARRLETIGQGREKTT